METVCKDACSGHDVDKVSKRVLYGGKVLAVLEITVGHWPFSQQFQHFVNQNSFGQPNFLYISNGTAISGNLSNVPSSKNGQPISDPYCT